MDPSSQRRAPDLRPILLAAPLIVGALALFLRGPIPQDSGYHSFADQRSWEGVPHAGDVLSNAAFLFAGAFGLLVTLRAGSSAAFRGRPDRLAYSVFFAGVFLTAFGSSWYHLAPDTNRLFWDRLPMTVAFLGLLNAVIAERVSLRLASLLLWPCVAAGVASVWYWRVTENAGHGDLRLYALVQYGPILTIALLLLVYPPRFTLSGALWGAAGLYVLAKLLELEDAPILRATRIVSGHTVKHLAAAASAALIAWMLARRRATVTTPELSAFPCRSSPSVPSRLR